MKKGSMVGILVLIVLLVIGFATISTSIMINGNANLSFNQNYFNVIFTEATTDGTYNISEDKQEINYITKGLSNVGDKSVIEYKVKNDSYQYDANVLLDIVGEEYKDKYRITYEVIDDSNPYTLESKRSITAKITIELISSISSSINIPINIRLNLTAIGRTVEGVDTYTIVFNGNGSTSGSMDSQEIEYDSTVNLIPNTFIRDNYTFIGWSTTANGSVEYINNSEVTNLTEPGNIITLYAIWISNIYNFDYTGNVQTFTIPIKGTYKLETWGAQGGNSSNFTGGYGAYSVGYFDSSKSPDGKLYIYVGGAGGGGGLAGNYAGGYNGGGVKKTYSGGAARHPSSGGGATHISLTTGLLASYSNPTNASKNVLIVSGGGGGATYQSNDTCGHGGNGGGYAGNSGIPGSACSYAVSQRRYGTGGNQSTGGTTVGCYNNDNENKGKFGSGATNAYNLVLYHISGGGGGWYGGGSDGCAGPGGGGSGWIASTNLTSISGNNKHMTCYNCATNTSANTYTKSNTCVSGTATTDCSKTGAGYARITLISVS